MSKKIKDKRFFLLNSCKFISEIKIDDNFSLSFEHIISWLKKKMTNFSCMYGQIVSTDK